MRDPFLRTERHDRFGLGIEVHIVAPLIPVADRLAQAGYPFRLGVPVRVPALHRLDEFVDDVAGRRLIRVTHAEVDDVLATTARLTPQRVSDTEDVGGQALDARELVHHSAGLAIEAAHYTALAVELEGNRDNPVAFGLPGIARLSVTRHRSASGRQRHGWQRAASWRRPQCPDDRPGVSPAGNRPA